MPFLVEFDDNGQIIRAISTGVEGVKKGLGQEARPGSMRSCANQLRDHKVKQINSVAIITTKNPHVVIYQGGKYIVLPHK